MKKNRPSLASGFAAYMSVTTPQQVMDWGKEDLTITKYAGTILNNPTQSNIEDFIHRHMLNEVKGNSSVQNIHVFFQPSEFSTLNKDLVVNGSGIVNLEINKINIEIPFIFANGELAPFDVIQMGDERVPYSRDNLFRIIEGAATYDPEEAEDDFKPYIGLDRGVTGATQPGFMGEVLRIQNSIASLGSRGMSVVADSRKILDKTMEKLAKVRPITDNDYKKLESQIRQRVATERIKNFEKIAKEVESDLTKEATEKLFSDVEKIKWTDAASVKNGTIIKFAERDRNEVKLTKAAVFTNTHPYFKNVAPKMRMIVTIDGRVKILAATDKFPCILSEDKTINIKSQSLRNIERGMSIIILKDGKITPPLDVNISSVGIANNGEGFRANAWSDNISKKFEFNSASKIDIYHLQTVTPSRSSIYSPIISSSNFRSCHIELVKLPGTNFDFIKRDDFNKIKAKELGLQNQGDVDRVLKDDYIIIKKPDTRNCTSRYDNQNILPEYEETVFCADELSRIIVIQGTIDEYLKNTKDIHNFVSETERDQISKIAMGNEYLEVKRNSSDNEKYDISVTFIDRSERVYKPRTRRFTSLDENKAREIIKGVGFDISKVSEMVVKAKKEGYGKYELPITATPDNLIDGGVGGTVCNIMNGIKKTVFSPTVSDAIATNVISALITSSFGGPQTSQAVQRYLKSASEESKALSVVFEKMAAEKDSDDLLDIAKLMATSSIYHDKVYEIVKEAKNLSNMISITSDIIDLKPFMEKVAYDIIGIKTFGYANGEHAISPDYLTGVIRNLDGFYKLAATMGKEAGLFKPTTLDLYKPSNQTYEDSRDVSAAQMNKMTKVAEETQFKVASENGKKKDDVSVCQSCGKKRDEKITPHCACGHDHTIPKKEYEAGLNKEASETFYYHASPVQGIKKFRLSEDTSGNGKGPVVFASKQASFSAAFGLKWNDANARLIVETSGEGDKKGYAGATSDNYDGCVFKYTDDVAIEKPCSMYRLKGKFTHLRFPKDIESITKDIPEIISEEKFDSFKDMAKAYGLKLQKVSKDHILNQLKGKKTTNFEKQASDKNKYDKSIQTSFLRDRIVPEVGRGLGAALAGTAVAGATYLGGVKPMSAMNAGAVTALGTDMILRDKSLINNSQKYLNRKPTAGERTHNIAMPIAGSALGGVPLGLSTPESQVKRRARAEVDGVDSKGLTVFNDKKKHKEMAKQADAPEVALQIAKDTTKSPSLFQNIKNTLSLKPKINAGPSVDKGGTVPVKVASDEEVSIQEQLHTQPLGTSTVMDDIAAIEAASKEGRKVELNDRKYQQRKLASDIEKEAEEERDYTLKFFNLRARRTGKSEQKLANDKEAEFREECKKPRKLNKIADAVLTTVFSPAPSGKEGKEGKAVPNTKKDFDLRLQDANDIGDAIEDGLENAEEKNSEI